MPSEFWLMCAPQAGRGTCGRILVRQAGGNTQVTRGKLARSSAARDQLVYCLHSPRPCPLSLAFPVGGEARTGAASTRVGSSVPPPLPLPQRHLLAARVDGVFASRTFPVCCSHPSFKYEASLCSASQHAEPECAFPKMSSCLPSCPHSGHTFPPRLGLSYYNGLQQRKSHYFSLQ